MTIADIFSTVEGAITAIIGSTIIVALTWISIWTSTIWVANKRHKELIARLDRIERMMK